MPLGPRKPSVFTGVCWRCDRKPVETDIGLCEACSEYLHDNKNFPDAPLIEEEVPFGQPSRKRNT